MVRFSLEAGVFRSVSMSVSTLVTFEVSELFGDTTLSSSSDLVLAADPDDVEHFNLLALLGAAPF